MKLKQTVAVISLLLSVPYLSFAADESVICKVPHASNAAATICELSTGKVIILEIDGYHSSNPFAGAAEAKYNGSCQIETEAKSLYIFSARQSFMKPISVENNTINISAIFKANGDGAYVTSFLLSPNTDFLTNSSEEKPVRVTLRCKTISVTSK